MTSPGSLITQLENAIASGNLASVRLIARELEASTGRWMPLASALTTLLLIRARRIELYQEAVAVLLARLLDELNRPTLAEAGLLVEAFEMIEQRHLPAAERDLRDVLAPRRQERPVEALRSPPRGSPRAWRWSPLE
jgi:hypothetical protein